MDTLEQPEADVDGMLGNSLKMQQLVAQIRRVAVTDIPVLLVGEKGTGRSLAARTMHQLSSQHEGPFTRIDCGFTSKDDLIGAELFGPGQLAFSGACTQRSDHMELSHAGSLFLHQIDALSLPLQAALVYYLDKKVAMRVGVRRHVTNGTRLIAATDQDLQRAIVTGSFLEDLFVRFAVLPVPALRERVDDILLLADAFLKKCNGGYGKYLTGFSPDAREAMMTYPWPGNVQELEHRIMRAAVRAEDTNVTPQDLELAGIRDRMNLQEAREAFEKEWIAKALALCEGNITHAANKLGVSRTTLYDLMHRLGLPRC